MTYTVYHQSHPRGAQGKRSYASSAKAHAVAARASRLRKTCVGVFRNFDGVRVAMFCNGEQTAGLSGARRRKRRR